MGPYDIGSLPSTVLASMLNVEKEIFAGLKSDFSFTIDNIREYVNPMFPCF